jgi:NAD(P)H-dependent flavin oxidoreductase YrpB (nitropropane dioxygenase family)
MSTIQTDLCELLGIEYPIIQAAMGPSGTVELAASVSNAGGLGMVSIGSETAGEREARESFSNAFDFLTKNTDGNFGVNIPAGSSKMPNNVEETLDAYLEETLVSKVTDDKVADQLKVLETSAGNPERWIDKINEVKEETDLLHFHKAASVKHAKKAEELGVDGITASGYEMGGHTHNEDDAAHTFVLLPAVTETVDVPVVASGGVRDGRGLLAALSLGAQGVYMGTRFIATQEADFNDEYKEYLIESGPGSDTIMDGVFGPARVLESPGIEQLNEVKDEMDIESFTDLKDKKLIIAQQGNIDEGIVIGGQVAGYIDDKPTVEELMNRIMDEAVTAYEQIQVVD